MKIKRIIIFTLMIILLACSVSAITYMQAGDDFYDTDGYACQVQNESDCRVWESYFTLEYRDDSSLFRRLSEQGLSSQTISGNYKFFLEYKLFDGTVGAFAGRTENASIECYKNCNDIACNDTLVISQDFNESDTTDVIYQEFNLRNSEFLRCTLTTVYNSNAVALTQNRFNFRFWNPSYESEQTEPDRRTILNLESEVEELEGRIDGEYKSTLDYTMSALKSLIQLNFNLWVYFYWFILIGFAVGVFSLIIYIIYWIYRKMRNL